MTSEQFDFSDHRLPPLRGFCGVGVERPKFPENVSSIVRSAQCFGADFVFSTGQGPKSGPCVGHDKHIPVFTNTEIPSIKPNNAELVAIEYTENSTPLSTFTHPERAVYVAGRENVGVKDETLRKADHTVHFRSAWCENVATAVSITLRDRLTHQLND